MKRVKKLTLFTLGISLMGGCGLADKGAGQEFVQTLGLLSEIMSSVDEALYRSEVSTVPVPTSAPGVEGESCRRAPGVCADGALSLSYNKCTYDSRILEGRALLKYFGDNRCRVDTANEYLVRVPNFTTKNDTLSLYAKTSVINEATDGMTLKRVASNSFEVSVKDLRRQVFNSDEAEIVNQTLNVATSSPLLIAGERRSGRTLTGGAVVIDHNLKEGVQTELTANGLLWTAACSCPVAGSWTGRYLDPNNDVSSEREIHLRVEMGLCGRAELTLENLQTSLKESFQVRLENCISL